MTRKSTLSVAGGSALALAALLLVFLKPGDDGSSTETQPAAEEAAGVSSRTRDRAAAARSAAGDRAVAVAGLPAPRVSPHDPESDEHADWVEARSKELLDLAWNEDEESMLTILTELRNPDPEIRHVAADATREFGSRDAIPMLQRMASADLAQDEKKACRELIEWLELPTLSEHIAEQKRQLPPAKAEE